MLRKYVLLFFLFISNFIIFADDSDNFYISTSSSVVYIKHEIFLDPEFCGDLTLFQVLERVMDSELLETYIPVSSGSGFFLDSSGAVLTNRHVLQAPDFNALRESLSEEFASSIKENYRYRFREEDLDRLAEGFNEMLMQGEYRFSVVAGDRVYEDISILASAPEDGSDLAVFMIYPDESFSGIRLADSTEMEEDVVGRNVYSFGFPLGSIMDRLFKDRAVTMNQGVISAYRNDELDVQHSAAISPGNSGGPLVDENRNVVGVNTAILNHEQGNSLFYAIGANKIREFLADSGLEDLVKWNDRVQASARMAGTGVADSPADIESSGDVVINTEEKARVYLDGEYAGEAPLYITLENESTDLEIRSDSGEFKARLIVSESMTGVTVIDPPLHSPVIQLRIDSEPSGAEVVADGRKLGTTPLETVLPYSTYRFELYKAGTYFEPIEFELNRDNTSLQVVGEDAAPIYFPNPPEKGAVPFYDYLSGHIDGVRFNQPIYKFTSGEREIRQKAAYQIWLPSGMSWTLELLNVPVMNGVRIPVDLTESFQRIELENYIPGASLTIRNLPFGAELWVDGELWESIGEEVHGVPIGRRNIFVWKDGYQPLEVDINVRPDGSSYVTWQGKTGYDAWGRAFSLGSGVSALTGTAMLAINAWGRSGGSEANTGQLGKVGTGMLVSSLVMGMVSLYQWKKYNAQKNELNKLKENE